MRRKAIEWVVIYQTKDLQEHEVRVTSKSIEGAVFQASKLCRQRKQRWFKAKKVWPYDETEHLPGLRLEAAANIPKNEPKKYKTKHELEIERVDREILEIAPEDKEDEPDYRTGKLAFEG